MIRPWLLIGAVAAVAGCGKPAPVDTCVSPNLTPTESPNTYAGEREAARICVKRAAFEMTRARAPLAGVPQAAVAGCAAEEAAIGKSGTKLYDWQRAQLHEDLTHLAKLTAVQARSIGCGRGPGDPSDTL